MARQVRAFVLSGGGARGALQVGAIRALLEAGLEEPDLLVGTSIGACNAGYLALNGLSLASVEKLEALWRDAATAGLMPSRYLWLTVRALMRPSVKVVVEQRLRNFFIAHGITPDLDFGQIKGTRLLMVAADLNTGQTVLYGTSADDNVLDGLMASTALPPWFRPVRRGGKTLVDGGFLSILPIEPALKYGATDIIALDLSDPFGGLSDTAVGLRPGFQRALAAIQQHQMDMELRLAEAQGVPVTHIRFRRAMLPPIWDFSHTEELMAEGYATARSILSGRQTVVRSTRWWTAPDWLARSAERMRRLHRAA